jgi:serine/threonine protein kinase
LDSLARLASALADRYRIERELGAGGMATVYLAHDLRHNRQVAIKVLRPELAAALGADRFLREIETTANLQHPNIVPLFDSGAVHHDARPTTHDLLYYVMPFIDGETLRSRLARTGPLPFDEVTRYTDEIADALAKAHKAGVVHRDIKPENIFLADGHALVLDFGIAKAVASSHRPEGPSGPRDPATPSGPSVLTTLGVSIGTPAYMAPEQVAGDPGVDHRVDIYALGLVAYEMLAGGSPYNATTPAQLMAAHIAQAPAPIGLKRADCPPALAALVMRCLEKEPGKRWQSADDIVSGLRTATTAVMPHRASPGSGRRTAIIAGVILLAAAAFVLLRRRTPPPVDPASSSVIAVLPFTVRGGPQLAWLGEGIVDLLSASLDGAAGLRSVNAHALLGFTGQDASVMTVERAGAIADHFKAGLFVMGDVLEVGGKLRLSASLFDRNDETHPLAEATVDGEPGDVTSLVDLLATRLAADRSAEGGARLTRTAAVTTSSIPALKAYMAGEQAYRAGQYVAATKAFQEAVAADTGFALAFHRLGMAQERMAWADDATRSAELAYRQSSRLSTHDRRFLEALLTMRRGHAEEAEQQFRAIAQSWPDDAEAWYQLGELSFHGSPLRGTSFADSRDAFSQALFLDPGDLGALYHLMRIAARDADKRVLDSLSARFYKLSPEGDRTLELRALQALATGDSVTVDSVMAAFGRAPDGTLAIGMWSLAVFAQSLPAAGRIAHLMTEPARPRDVRAQGHVYLAYVALAQGRLGLARSELAAATALGGSEAPLVDAWFTTLPFVPATRAELDAARARLARWDATDTTLQSTQPSAFFSGHNGVRSILKLYVLGLLDVRRGAGAEALAEVGQLQAMGGTTTGPPLALELAEGLRAQRALAQDKPDSALSALEALHLEGWYELTFMSPFYGGALERFTRAQLLQQRGRGEEALRWYGSLSQNSMPELVFLAPATLAEARIQRALNHPAEAASLYDAFLELWRNADPVFKPMLDSARAERASS